MSGAQANAAAQLHQFLAEADVPCPGCGYNLRGLQGSSCPECELPLKVGLIASETWPQVLRLVRVFLIVMIVDTGWQLFVLLRAMPFTFPLPPPARFIALQWVFVVLRVVYIACCIGAFALTLRRPRVRRETRDLLGFVLVSAVVFFSLSVCIRVIARFI